MGRIDADASDVYERTQSAAFNLMVSIAGVSKLSDDAVDQLVFKRLSPVLFNAVVGSRQFYQLPVTVDRRHNMFLVDVARRPNTDQSTSILKKQ